MKIEKSNLVHPKQTVDNSALDSIFFEIPESVTDFEKEDKLILDFKTKVLASH